MAEKRIVRVEMFVEDVQKIANWLKAMKALTVVQNHVELDRIVRVLEAYTLSPEHNTTEHWK